MNTQYIDSMYSDVIFTVLIIFLLMFALLFVFMIFRFCIARKKSATALVKRTDNDDRNKGYNDFKERCSGDKSSEHDERQLAEQQHKNALIIGCDKYIGRLQHELELTDLLKWNEKQSSASSVGEITGEYEDCETDTAVIKKKIACIKGRFTDHTDIQAKFALLNIRNIRYKLTDNGNFIVDCEVSVMNKQHEFDSAEKILDGSLEVAVKDGNGVIIAKGYACADGFNETELSRAGFVSDNDRSRSKRISAVCITERVSPDLRTEKCSMSFSPFRLWTIEK